MSNLTKRLLTIANLVDRDKICDVGCDHGKLSKYLLDQNIVKEVIISDISKPSLQKAVDLLQNAGYHFDAIVCDGLLGYANKQVDQCIIAGMGGDEIIKIIKEKMINFNILNKINKIKINKKNIFIMYKMFLQCNKFIKFIMMIIFILLIKIYNHYKMIIEHNKEINIL